MLPICHATHIPNIDQIFTSVSQTYVKHLTIIILLNFKTKGPTLSVKYSLFLRENY